MKAKETKESTYLTAGQIRGFCSSATIGRHRAAAAVFSSPALATESKDQVHSPPHLFIVMLFNSETSALEEPRARPRAPAPRLHPVASCQDDSEATRAGLPSTIRPRDRDTLP